MGSQIRFIPFQPENQTAVRSLILDGLAEHWGQLDPRKNPDLNDIATTYAKAHFLVAWDENTIIGTGALVCRTVDTAEIVRMSVSRKVRRQGIGRMILEQLIAKAKEEGVNRITLETTETWQEVIAFYLSAGFHITHCQDGDVYFEMVVDNSLI